MAGPTSAVFLDFAPTDQLRADIQTIIAQISTNVEGQDFRVSNTLPIGGTINIASPIEARPFLLALESIAEEGFHQAGELTQIEAFFHFRPLYSLSLIAMCSRAIDHRILGEMTLYFAQQLNAVIYFDGLLSATETTGIGGKTQDIICEIADEEKAACYTVCDAEFMNNWLKSPNFKMIK